MCGCERHRNKDAECTCICPEHGNFQAAHDLAMSRYDDIVRLKRELEALRDPTSATLKVPHENLPMLKETLVRAQFAIEGNYPDTKHRDNAAIQLLLDQINELLPGGPTCGACRRERTLGNDEHPMDAYDYSPLQVVSGKPLGWYSGDDGEMCPECMTKMMRGQ